jgi:hypothetical protein
MSFLTIQECEWHVNNPGSCYKHKISMVFIRMREQKQKFRQTTEKELSIHAY